MRSRYTAYVLGAIDYLGDTLHPSRKRGWDRAVTAQWAKQSRWLGLEIMMTEAGAIGDREGFVSFRATYADAYGATRVHTERSRFRCEGARWYYVEGAPPRRNDPCLCGSGKKYKKCCGSGAD